MFCVKVALVLSAILMTRSTQIDDDVLDKTPLSEALYVFDVSTDAPVDDVMTSLSPVQQLVRHYDKFQVIGERRYYFVVVNDQSEAVRQIAFPLGSNVSQYPVEHAHDYLTLFGVEGWNMTDTTDMFVDENLTLCITDYFPDGNMNATLLKRTMKIYGDTFRNAAEQCGCAPYFVVGRNPPKYFLFMNQADSVTNRITLHGLDLLGIIGKISYLHLRLI